MRVIDYRVIEEQFLSVLAEKVNVAIEKGWQPQGGVCVIFNDGGSTKGYVQAMVKYEDI